MGKKLIMPIKEYTPSIWRDSSEKNCRSLLLVLMKMVTNISNTSDEKKLADFFSKNKRNTFFLTPVFLRKKLYKNIITIHKNTKCKTAVYIAKDFGTYDLIIIIPIM